MSNKIYLALRTDCGEIAHAFSSKEKAYTYARRNSCIKIERVRLDMESDASFTKKAKLEERRQLEERLAELNLELEVL